MSVPTGPKAGVLDGISGKPMTQRQAADLATMAAVRIPYASSWTAPGVEGFRTHVLVGKLEIVLWEEAHLELAIAAARSVAKAPEVTPS